MGQEYPSLNEIAPSWADIQTTFTVYGGDLLEMSDYAGIKWEDALEIGEQRGASGGRILKRTTGAVTPTASATLYRSGHLKLLRALKSKAPVRGNQRRVGLVGFDITIQHTPPGSVEIFEVQIRGCRLSKRSFDGAEGTDADKIEIELNPLEIVELIDGEEIVLI